MTRCFSALAGCIFLSSVAVTWIAPGDRQLTAAEKQLIAGGAVCEDSVDVNTCTKCEALQSCDDDADEAECQRYYEAEWHLRRGCFLPPESVFGCEGTKFTWASGYPCIGATPIGACDRLYSVSESQSGDEGTCE